ncbi:hypothetical protein IID19_04190 [Patescibacteria group bacterium]|nr:hypothetical protein [Patescibacteria group bacterium]
MDIGSIYIPEVLLYLFLGLAVLFILCYRRRVTHDGQWELGDKKSHAWTDELTGTSFATKYRVLMPNELGSRRQKFGKPVWSWPITIVVLALVALTLHGIGII